MEMENAMNAHAMLENFKNRLARLRTLHFELRLSAKIRIGRRHEGVY
jgi:hypothetical protein